MQAHPAPRQAPRLETRQTPPQDDDHKRPWDHSELQKCGDLHRSAGILLSCGCSRMSIIEYLGRRNTLRDERGLFGIQEMKTLIAGFARNPSLRNFSAGTR
jgi:hypothetical protein